ncbi:MAG TPA: signal peptide peptidase SppA [Thermoanaerobaculia bacterium]|nr:signal peptide peptidase SppA [Thermoanaerobaculia bacterium]
MDPSLPPPSVEPPSGAAGVPGRPTVGDDVRRSPKSRAPIFFLGALSGCAIVFFGFFFLVFFVALSRQDSGELSLSTSKIAIIPIEGEILDARDTVDLLRKYSRNSTVKAIVMRINSPGGAIAPSQEIYSEIRKTRQKSGKPIVASLDSVGASGGYYIAAACDEIVANPGSITGSIGVILDWMEVDDLIKWAKMKRETITSGPMKAAGSPFRKLTDTERQYLQRIVLQLHQQFVKAVAEGRAGKITEQQVAQLADGRVFTGEEALSLKLIDRLGNLGDAVTLAARKAGVRGEPSTIYPRKREHTLLDLITDSSDTESMVERIAARRMPRFLYRW